ncbi:nucleotidyltransferase domain-containing protein [Desulfobacterales bacterium HSG2]|nr:nucleotidyltransferase domain-containing protein [Desulfobacterales bacterium HSG2]
MSTFCYDKLKARWRTEQSERRRRSARMKAALMTNGPPVFRKFGIQKVWLFGSVISEKAERTSDMDILAIPLPGDQYWACMHELEEVVSYPIDLYTQGDDSEFTDKIMNRGEIIYEVQS